MTGWKRCHFLPSFRPEYIIFLWPTDLKSVSGNNWNPKQLLSLFSGSKLKHVDPSVLVGKLVIQSSTVIKYSWNVSSTLWDDSLSCPLPCKHKRFRRLDPQIKTLNVCRFEQVTSVCQCSDIIILSVALQLGSLIVLTQNNWRYLTSVLFIFICSKKTNRM